MRSVILIVVAILITVIVYGAVALIIKMDDMDLSLTQRTKTTAQKVGRFLVAEMPKVMLVLSIIGTAAMLWVGGHILLVGLHESGVLLPYEWVHHPESAVAGMSGTGGFAAWLARIIHENDRFFRVPFACSEFCSVGNTVCIPPGHVGSFTESATDKGFGERISRFMNSPG